MSEDSIENELYTISIHIKQQSIQIDKLRSENQLLRERMADYETLIEKNERFNQLLQDCYQHIKQVQHMLQQQNKEIESLKKQIETIPITQFDFSDHPKMDEFRNRFKSILETKKASSDGSALNQAEEDFSPYHIIKELKRIDSQRSIKKEDDSNKVPMDGNDPYQEKTTSTTKINLITGNQLENAQDKQVDGPKNPEFSFNHFGANDQIHNITLNQTGSFAQQLSNHLNTVTPLAPPVQSSFSHVPGISPQQRSFSPTQNNVIVQAPPQSFLPNAINFPSHQFFHAENMNQMSTNPSQLQSNNFNPTSVILGQNTNNFSNQNPQNSIQTLPLNQINFVHLNNPINQNNISGPGISSTYPYQIPPNSQVSNTQSPISHLTNISNPNPNPNVGQFLPNDHLQRVNAFAANTNNNNNNPNNIQNINISGNVNNTIKRSLSPLRQQNLMVDSVKFNNIGSNNSNSIQSSINVNSQHHTPIGSSKATHLTTIRTNSQNQQY